MRPNPYTELERLQISVWPFQRHWSCYFHYIETVPIHWNLSIYNCHHGTTGDCLFRSFSIGLVQLGAGAGAVKWWLPLTVTTMNRFHCILVLTGFHQLPFMRSIFMRSISWSHESWSHESWSSGNWSRENWSRDTESSHLPWSCSVVNSVAVKLSLSSSDPRLTSSAPAMSDALGATT